MDNATAALAKMNMILHDCPTAEIWKDNTLSSAALHATTDGLKTFDFVVANPPFSNKAWSNGFDPAEDDYHRFEYGIPPAKNGDYAFLLHILALTQEHRQGRDDSAPRRAVPRQRGGRHPPATSSRRGYIKGIIGLPANLFYGTGIPACIIVLDKENAACPQAASS